VASPFKVTEAREISAYRARTERRTLHLVRPHRVRGLVVRVLSAAVLVIVIDVTACAMAERRSDSIASTIRDDNYGKEHSASDQLARP
jgi:hypothetical protein